jgi:hypothetical protein
VLASATRMRQWSVKLENVEKEKRKVKTNVCNTKDNENSISRKKRGERTLIVKGRE